MHGATLLLMFQVYCVLNEQQHIAVACIETPFLGLQILLAFIHTHTHKHLHTPYARTFAMKGFIILYDFQRVF